MTTTEAPAPIEPTPLLDAFAIPIERIEPNPFQPRINFPASELAELTQSIEQFGVLQPPIVRVHPLRTGWFQLVSGERRWRAAQMAGLETLPVIVRDFNDLESAEVALQENIQRQSLTDLEEAMGVRQLLTLWEESGVELSNRQMARKLGVSETYISNCWKVLGLPPEMQKIASERRGVKSSLFIINDVKDEPRRRKYLDKILNLDSSFREIQKEITRDDQEEKLRKATMRAPDTQTQQRQTAVAQGQTGSMSRGVQLTGGSTKDEARIEISKNINALIEWLPLLSDEDFEKYVLSFGRRIVNGDLRRGR